MQKPLYTMFSLIVSAFMINVVSIGSAQATVIYDAAQIKEINCPANGYPCETNPLKLNGYRHNTDIIGSALPIVFDGVYDMYYDGFLSNLWIWINGQRLSANLSQNYAEFGEFHIEYDLPAPCQKLVIQLEMDFAFTGLPECGGVGDTCDLITGPLEIYVISNSNNGDSCLPECDECTQQSTGQATGFPVNVITGKMFYTTTDITLEGPQPLVFSRHYDNQSGYNKDLGVGWRHNFSHSLDVTNPNLIWYENENGERIGYGKRNDGTYERDWVFLTRLSREGTGWKIETRNATTYHFDAAGLLTSITLANGDEYLITRDASNRIQEVTDNFGRRLKFVYTDADPKIQSVEVYLAGDVIPRTSISFAYTGTNLTAFTDQLGKTWQYQYDPVQTDNLTAVIDPLGHILEQHTYDAADRTVTSSRSGGVESITFSYGLYQTTTVDSLGNNTTYLWDRNLKVITNITGTATGGGAESRSFSWSNTLLKLSETDGNGNMTMYDYYAVQIPGANGYGQWFLTDNLASITEAAGTPTQRVTTFKDYYDLAPVLDLDEPRRGLYRQKEEPSVDTPGPNNFIVTQLDYDANRNLTSRSVTGYVNGVAETHTELWSYGPHSQILSYNGPRTDVTDITTYSYYSDTDPMVEARGQLQSITNALGHTITYDAYHFTGQPTQTTDANGVVANSVYNDRGQLISQTLHAELDQTTQYFYHDDTLLDYIVHPEGNVTDYTYDPQHRLTYLEEKPDAQPTTHGIRIARTYNTESLLIREEYQKWDGNQFISRKQVEYDYDAFKRLWKSINPDGTFTEYTYDPAGNLLYLDDANHPCQAPACPPHYVSYAYDSLNRLTSVTLHPTNPPPNTDVVTTYLYDAQDNITQVTDPNGLVTTFKYDDFGRLIQTVSPDSGTTQRTYDFAGNLLSETDAEGINVTRTYDALNRILAVTYADPQYNVFYTYDDASASNGIGRLTKAVSCIICINPRTVRYNYAKTGLLSDETVELLFQPHRVTSYTYDRNGNMTGITYPTGRTVTYTVEPYLGLSTAVATTVNGAPQAILSNISYEPFGPLAGGTYGNGAALARGYDLRYRMTSNISGNLINVTYGYDNETNITSIAGSYDRTYGYDDLYRLTSAEGTFTVFGPVTVARPAGGPPAPVTQTFTVDNPGPTYVLRVYNGGLGDDLPRVSSGRVWLNGNLIVRPNDFNQNVRLIEKPVALQSVNELTVELQSSPQSGVTLQVIDTADPLTVPHVPGPFTIAYSYDANGNRLTKTVNGCTNTYLYAAGTNRLTQVTGGCGEDNTFSYNGRGDVIQDAFHTFEYGDHRRMVSIDGGETAHYDYDEKLRRYNYNRLEFNSSASDQLLTEIVNVPGSNEGNFVDYIYLGAEPIARVEGDLDTPGAGETVYFYHNDHLMTPLFLSDAGQNTVWQGEYYPFGALYSERYSVDNRLRFPGQYDDRLPTGAPLYYNWNRFYAPNIGRYTQIDPVSLQNLKINPYDYALSNPIVSIDIDGLVARICCRPLNIIVIKMVPKARHCFIVADDGTIYSLFREKINGKTYGVTTNLDPKKRDDPDRKNVICKTCPCKGDGGVEAQNRCFKKAYEDYPKRSEYKILGPNSNTFAGTLAKKCCKGGIPPGLGNPPGINHAPPEKR